MRVDVVAGRFDVAHRPLARMALQVERHAVLLAQRPRPGRSARRAVPGSPARTSGIAWPPIVAGSGGNRNQWLQQWAGEPTKPGSGDLAVLQLAEVPGAGGRRRAGPSAPARGSACRPRRARSTDRCAAACCPCRARPCTPATRLAADEVQRLGARLVAEHLALQVGGDGEDFQPVLLGQVDALLGVGGGAGVGVALAQVEFPARLLPAVEAGVLR